MTSVAEVTAVDRRSLRVAGLFAGIGGLEVGLDRNGHTTELLCEVDPYAAAVLSERFAHVQLSGDIRELTQLPEVDLVVGGFPCQDLSLAGTQQGIHGAKSGLVSHMFRLIRKSLPEFVLFENVLYLIKRDRGAQLRLVTDELESLGYRWAYRVVDTRGFGLPQRRQRVVILASLGSVAPEDVLFAEQVKPIVNDSIGAIEPPRHYGFYWTEGKRAIGWAPEAVPTIKGGSGLGIPSPPAIFDSSRSYAGTPTITDGERLQGFDAGWTDVLFENNPIKVGKRWHLIGNAVSVPVSDWIGRSLASPRSGVAPTPVGEMDFRRPMPWAAAWNGSRHLQYDVSPHVLCATHEPVSLFLREPTKPLSKKALTGFLSRVASGVVTLPDEFVSGLSRQRDSTI